MISRKTVKVFLEAPWSSTLSQACDAISESDFRSINSSAEWAEVLKQFTTVAPVYSADDIKKILSRLCDICGMSTIDGTSSIVEYYIISPSIGVADIFHPTPPFEFSISPWKGEKGEKKAQILRLHDGLTAALAQHDGPVIVVASATLLKLINISAINTSGGQVQILTNKAIRSLKGIKSFIPETEVKEGPTFCTSLLVENLRAASVSKAKTTQIGSHSIKAVKTSERVDKATENENRIGIKIDQIRREMADEYLAEHPWPWVIGYSGGKDSTLVAQLAIEMLLDLSPSERRRPIHILTNDTKVESPIYSAHVDRQVDAIRSGTEALGLPVHTVCVKPPADQTFWVNLIGRGYPSPNRQFRWCTDRMKIQPTSDYIRSQVSSAGQCILLLGVRKAESATRAQSVDRHGSARLNPHSSLAGCLVYRPIMNLSTDEVWEYLMQAKAPWGGTHRELVALYQGAQGGECPLITDQSEKPGCGTNSSRFGCWTCTVVEKDKSLQAYIDNGHEHLASLVKLRDWLAEIRNDVSLRENTRRNGMTGLGPFTISTRRVILEKLLATQNEVGFPLISEEEIILIKDIWSADLLTMGGRAFGQTIATLQGAP